MSCSSGHHLKRLGLKELSLQSPLCEINVSLIAPQMSIGLKALNISHNGWHDWANGTSMACHVFYFRIQMASSSHRVVLLWNIGTTPSFLLPLYTALAVYLDINMVFPTLYGQWNHLESTKVGKVGSNPGSRWEDFDNSMGHRQCLLRIPSR